MKRHHTLYLALIFSFILGIHDGNIALWQAGQTEPLRVFPYRSELLPPEARAALRDGVQVESLEQLEALAENYLS